MTLARPVNLSLDIAAELRALSAGDPGAALADFAKRVASSVATSPRQSSRTKSASRSRPAPSAPGRCRVATY